MVSAKPFIDSYNYIPNRRGNSTILQGINNAPDHVWQFNANYGDVYAVVEPYQELVESGALGTRNSGLPVAIAWDLQ